MVEKPDESEFLTEAEMNFRLKGKTSAGRKWNENFDREIAEYKTAIDEDDLGLATSKAADIRKRYDGMQRKLQNLAESTERQRMVCLTDLPMG